MVSGAELALRYSVKLAYEMELASGFGINLEAPLGVAFAEHGMVVILEL